MKKLCVLLLGLVTTTSLLAQDPQEVIKKAVAAMGGEDAVARYSDYQAEGEAKYSMWGRELTGTIEIIEKGKKKRTKTELALGKSTFVMINAFDGEIAFSERQGRIIDKPALNYESDLDHTLGVLIDKGTVFSLGKQTEIDGRRATGIDAELNGKKTTFFIDDETFLVSEMVFEDTYFGENNTKELIQKRIRYENYEEFEGVRFPTRITFYEKGEKQQEFDIAEISFAPEVTAEQFRRPEQELDLRYSEERMD